MIPGDRRWPDPQDLPDWPLAGQLTVLAALAASLAAAAAAWWLPAYREQRFALTRRLQTLEQRHQALQSLARQLAARPPPRLGCNLATVRSTAAGLQLPLLLGAPGDDAPMAAWTEARAALLVRGSFVPLQRFVAELGTASPAVSLDRLTVRRETDGRLELQARVRCLRQPVDGARP